MSLPTRDNVDALGFALATVTVHQPEMESLRDWWRKSLKLLWEEAAARYEGCSFVFCQECFGGSWRALLGGFYRGLLLQGFRVVKLKSSIRDFVQRAISDRFITDRPEVVVHAAERCVDFRGCAWSEERFTELYRFVQVDTLAEIFPYLRQVDFRRWGIDEAEEFLVRNPGVKIHLGSLSKVRRVYRDAEVSEEPKRQEAFLFFSRVLGISEDRFDGVLRCEIPSRSRDLTKTKK